MHKYPFTKFQGNTDVAPIVILISVNLIMFFGFDARNKCRIYVRFLAENIPKKNIYMLRKTQVS